MCRRSTAAGRGAQRGVPGGRPPGPAQRTGPPARCPGPAPGGLSADRRWPVAGPCGHAVWPVPADVAAGNNTDHMALVILAVAPACNPLHAYRLAGRRGAGGREARRLASTSLGRARRHPDFGSSTSVPEIRTRVNEQNCQSRPSDGPADLQPQASLRMACPFVSGGWWWRGVSPRRRCAWRVLSCRAGGGGGVSPRRRCAWRVLSCRAGGGGGGSAPGVAAHGVSFRVGRVVVAGGQPQASLRMACPFVSGGWWWRGQPQASLRMACPFVSGGWWWRGQPQASLRMACPFVSGGWWWRGQPQASLRMASFPLLQLLRLREACGPGTRWQM